MVNSSSAGRRSPRGDDHHGTRVSPDQAQKGIQGTPKDRHQAQHNNDSLQRTLTSEQTEGDRRVQIIHKVTLSNSSDEPVNDHDGKNRNHNHQQVDENKDRFKYFNNEDPRITPS